MGSFLTSIKKEVNQITVLQFFNQPLIKVREFHGAFKSVCQNFPISQNQFYQIFGNQVQVFKILNTNMINLVDGLQIFSGLIAFAQECKFEQKVRFLFDVFDFNQLNSISSVQLQVMLIGICNFTYKILKKDAHAAQQDISQFVLKQFEEDKRITFNQILKWASKSDQIKTYFQIIKKEGPSQDDWSQNKPQKPNSDKNKLLLSKKPFQPMQISEMMQSKNFQQQQQWLTTISKKIFYPTLYSSTYKDIIITLDWVYGIRCADVSHPLLAITYQNTQILIYFTASIVVLYNPLINKQRIYKEHRKEIICTQSAPRKGFIISGEYGDQPDIRIWKIEDLQTVHVLKGMHQKGVSILKVFDNQDKLCTAGLRYNSSIIIFSLCNFQILLSTHISSPCIQLLNLNNFIGNVFIQTKQDIQIDNTIVVASIEDVYIYVGESNGYRCVKKVHVQKLIDAVVARQNVRNIQLSIYSEQNEVHFYLLTVHQTGVVLHSIVPQDQPYSLQGLQRGICLRKFKKGYIIGYQWGLKMFQIDFLQKKITIYHQIILQDIEIKMLGNTLNNIQVADSLIYILTNQGDILRFILQDQVDNRILYQHVTQVNKLPNLLKAISLLEKQETNDKILFVGGQDGNVYTYSMNSHQIVDTWKIKQPITALHSVCFQDGGTVFACGTINGKLHIRIDWEQTPRTYECGSQIIDLKISSDTAFLVACSIDQHFSVFIYNNNSYFNLSPKKFQLQNQIPLAVHFVDDNKSFLIATSHRNLYQVQFPQSKSKNLLQQNEKVHCTTWYLKYPLKIKNYPQKSMSVILGGDIKCMLATGQKGIIYYWRDKDQLKNHSGGFLNGHTSQISRLLMTNTQDKFLSIGLQDHTILQWGIKFTKSLKAFCKLQQKDQQSLSMVQNNQILQRQINYSYCSKNLYEGLRDHFVYFSGINSYVPSNLYKYFQPYKEQVMFRRAPPLSISLDHVYGFQTYDKRNSIAYLHEGQHLTKSRYRAVNPFRMPCRRRILYYASRVCVIHNVQRDQQTFYQGHLSKISCMCIHPQLPLIATSQSSYQPQIHIHNESKNYALHLQTIHKNGVVYIQFSRKQNFIISFGIRQNQYGIEVRDWKRNVLIAYRQVQKNSLFQIKFHPEKHKVFATCGTNQVSIWKVDTVNLQKYSQNVHQQIFTALVWVMLKGEDYDYDIVVGSSLGNLFIETQNRLFLLKRNYHNALINCLKLFQLNTTLCLLSASQDQTVKISNLSFITLLVVSPRQIEILRTPNKERNLEVSEKSWGIQSIDVCSCTKQFINQENVKQMVNKQNLLLGIRNGVILQLQVNGDWQVKVQNVYNSHASQIDCQSHSHNNYLNKKVFAALHPRKPLLITCGDDNKLLIWDTSQNHLIQKYFYSDTRASAIQFSPDGGLLIIGLVDGQIHILQCLLEKHLKNQKLMQIHLTKIHYIGLQSKKKRPISSIVFSSEGDYFAVSYSAYHGAFQKQQQSVESTCSFVSVFMNKNKEKSTVSFQKNLFSKCGDILSPNPQKHKSNMSQFASGVFFMSFKQYQQRMYLTLYYQLINDQNIRVNNDTQGEFHFFDVTGDSPLKKIQINPQIDFQSNSLSNLILSQYFILEQDFKIKKPVYSTMKRFKPILMLGSICGDLHFVKQNFVHFSAKEKQKGIAKTYPAHVSFINQIQLGHNDEFIYTTGLIDEVIFKWKLHQQNLIWQIDLGIYNIGVEDQLNEVQSRQSFYNMVNNVLPIRFQLSQIKLNVQQDVQPQAELKLVNIIGRRAYDRRNNLFYDIQNRMVYIAASGIIINGQEQEYVPVDSTQSSCYPQISCIHMSQDRRIVVAGTCQINASVILWDICSKICLKKIPLLNCILVICVKISQKNSHLCVNALTSDYVNVIIFISIQKAKVLGFANFKYSGTWRIKDIAFVKNNSFKFVTCGTQHMALWEYKGKKLTYKHLNLDLLYSDQQENIANDQQNQKKFIKFYCLVFYNQKYMICGSDTGQLFLWNQEFAIVQITHTHQSWIRSLSVFDKLIVSGGKDGKVVLHNIRDGKLEKLYQFKLVNQINFQANKQVFQYPINLDIQSVFLNQSHILVGTRTGDIYEIVIPKEKDRLYYKQQDGGKVINLRFAFHDQERPQSVCFSHDKDSKILKVFTISRHGYLVIWDIKNLSIIQRCNFKRNTENLIVCSNQKLIIAFENQINFLNIQNQNFSFYQNTALTYTAKITDVELSSNQKYLAIALGSTQSAAQKIQIYEIDWIDLSKKLIIQIKNNLTNNIEFMDFSKDNKYLLFKDRMQEVSIIDIECKKKINTLFVQFQIQWSSDGIRVSQKAKGIHPCYNNQNRMTKIAMIGDHTIAVGDQMGTIRLFEYPCEGIKSGICCLRCYPQHISYINNCLSNREHDYLITTGQADRCIYLWKIVKNNKKV